MSKLPSVPIVQRAVASRDDVRHVLGDMEDAKIMDILALRPSLAEVEAAAMWTTGDGDILAKGGRPLKGWLRISSASSPRTKKTLRLITRVLICCCIVS